MSVVSEGDFSHQSSLSYLFLHQTLHFNGCSGFFTSVIPPAGGMSAVIKYTRLGIILVFQTAVAPL